MTAEKTAGTTTGNLVTACIRRGFCGLGAKIVIVASDNRSVQEWVYRYLEPYEAKGYGFYLVERDADFLEYAGKSDTVTAFVEDIYFGERAIGRLDCIRKQYPKLRLVLFSASRLPLGTAARYVRWSMGSYLSLRDSEREIRETVEAGFRETAVGSAISEGPC